MTAYPAIPTLPRQAVLDAIDQGIGNAYDPDDGEQLSDEQVEALREYGRTTDYVTVGSFSPLAIGEADRLCGCPVTAALHDNVTPADNDPRSDWWINTPEGEFAGAFDDQMHEAICEDQEISRKERESRYGWSYVVEVVDPEPTISEMVAALSSRYSGVESWSVEAVREAYAAEVANA